MCFSVTIKIVSLIITKKKSYFENNFTIQRIKYNARPVPKNRKDTTNAILIWVSFHPNFPASQPDTPKIIFNMFKMLNSKGNRICFSEEFISVNSIGASLPTRNNV